MIELDGNITLVGFKELGFDDFGLIKSTVESYAKKIAQRTAFTNLRLTLKPIHKTTDEVTKFEIKAFLEVNDTHYHTEVVEHNLFAAIDTILKKLESQLRI